MHAIILQIKVCDQQLFQNRFCIARNNSEAGGRDGRNGYIENITKEFMINKEITRKQRELLCQRYQ